MCLCGMLAADYDTLPAPMQEAVIRFFDRSEGWLTGVFEQGRAEGSLDRDGSARQAAQALYLLRANEPIRYGGDRHQGKGSP